MFEQLSERLQSSLRRVRGQARLTEDNIGQALREVRVALLEADVALPVVKVFIESVRQRAIGQDVLGSLTPGQMVVKIVRDELVAVMGGASEGLQLAAPAPLVILVAGLQGAGKTTTCGKLALLLQERHKKNVMLASVDVYRPAAIDQLEILAKQTGAGFYGDSASSDPVAIAHEAVAQARRSVADVLILDTAGRLHVDENMMSEVRAIHTSVDPTETLFVVDSMTGQDAVHSARAFHDALPLTGIILTKTDGDARGGAAISLRHITGKPIKFLGTGEKLDGLEPFHPDRLASRILGMGDVLTLVEEVERKVDKQQAEKLAKKLVKGKGFDLTDFREQVRQLQNMGGLASVLDKIPGGDRLPAGIVNQIDGQQFKVTVAIIDSMTPHERTFPDVIKGARKRRIAAGSGTQVQDVNRLLKQFMQMQKTMKKMRKKGGMAQVLQGMRGRIPGAPF